MKLPKQSHKVDRHYFGGKNLVLKFFGQKEAKCAQNEVFQVFWKVNCPNFPELLHNVTVAFNLTVDYDRIFGISLF